MQIQKLLPGSGPLQTGDYNREHAAAMDRSKENANLKMTNKEINKNDVETVVERLNDFVEPLRTNLKFQMHDKLKEYYVTVVNPLTDEVIKEIPPKKMLDMYAAMAEFMGILIDEKI